MNAIDAAAKAIAKVEGEDIDELIEVSTPHGLTRVPAWQLYRLRARTALEAARDAVCSALETECEKCGGVLTDDDGDLVHIRSPDIDDLRAAYDRAIAP